MSTISLKTRVFFCVSQPDHKEKLFEFLEDALEYVSVLEENKYVLYVGFIRYSYKDVLSSFWNRVKFALTGVDNGKWRYVEREDTFDVFQVLDPKNY